MPVTTSADRSLNSAMMRRVLFSSFLGSAVEFYDFSLYSLAASVVFHHVFFDDLSPSLAVIASFGTLAAGYVARPLGGMLLGRIGDRAGRKSVLVASMIVMGVASVAIGLIPPHSMIGPVAPLLLVTLRIVQGIAVGGEFGGAMLMAVEHAPRGRRGFAASFANMGGPVGSLLASAAMAAASMLPDAAFFSWGWRVPFVLSIVLVSLGLVVRLKVTESPEFARLAPAQRAAAPVKEVFTRHPRQLVCGALAGLGGYACQGLLAVWAIGYAVSLGVERAAVLDMKMVGAFGMVFVIGWSAALGDRCGRPKVLLAGAAIGAVAAIPIVFALGSGHTAWTAVGIVLGQAIVQGILFGPFSAFLAELFPIGVRYTGSSISYQAASTFGAGFTPLIAAALLDLGGNVVVGVFFCATFVIAGVAVLGARPQRARCERNAAS